ncbi:MAG: uroporphyrinogen decarboxylase family protein [Phycisphaerae bacterium]|jgi:uroporphyrinogen decarboxylase|nr:uroporphyrinogen decarboxylase family protein [Phycisphaerae bacterium]
MTSRQRIIAAVNHTEPDRVPIDFGGHRSSGISAMAYGRLKQALGISAGDIYVYDMVQQLAIVEPEVLDAVGSDVVELGRGFMLDDADWRPWVLPDGVPCKIPAFINVEKRGNDSYLLSDDGVDLAIQKEGFLYFEQIHWPWLERNPDEQDFSDLQEAFKYTMWTGIPTPGGHIPLTGDGLAQLAAGAKRLRESTDRAILGIFGGNLFEVPQFLYRIDNYLTHMGFYPGACERLSEALCNFYLPRMEKWLGAVGPYIDVMLFGDDLGGQTGPLMSTEMYRAYYKPWHAKLWKRAKELAPHVNIHLHCCGGIEPLLGDLIEAGLESSNPVQITCQGMDPQHLKSTYGDRFTFWGGGCDTRRVLPHGTPDEVARDVRELVSIWSPGGGFIFQQVHNILADVPPENIIAMFEALR